MSFDKLPTSSIKFEWSVSKFCENLNNCKNHNIWNKSSSASYFAIAAIPSVSTPFLTRVVCIIYPQSIPKEDKNIFLYANEESCRSFVSELSLFIYETVVRYESGAILQKSCTYMPVTTTAWLPAGLCCSVGGSPDIFGSWLSGWQFLAARPLA